MAIGAVFSQNHKSICYAITLNEPEINYATIEIFINSMGYQIF